MRIIKTSLLREFWQDHQEAEASLRSWAQLTQRARWGNLVQVRQTFPSADPVTVASGRPVVIFNIAHNRYRLITAIHYNTQIVYTLRLLTHQEYDRGAWKDQL